MLKLPVQLYLMHETHFAQLESDFYVHKTHPKYGNNFGMPLELFQANENKFR